MRRIAFFLVAAVLAAQPALAQDELKGRLKARQMHQLLGGNTVLWNFSNVTQKQYFDPRGFTVFEDENQKIDKGVWTITQDDMFCSNWGNTGWACYELYADGATLVWKGPFNSFGDMATAEVTQSRFVRGNLTTYNITANGNQDAVVASVSDYLSGAGNF